MSSRPYRLLSIPTAAALLAGTVLSPTSPALAQDDQDLEILVFSKTAGFRHDSIEHGIALIEELGEEHGFGVDATEDATTFTEEELAGYDAVVWLSTTGDVLDEEQQAAFTDYIRSGGGYAGVHAASDTHYDWEWYGGLVGAYFASHPHIQEADILVEDADHPSTAHLPETWTITDEWYNFRENPRGDVHVLATLDETSYDPGSGAMGEDHPIAWCHDYDGGRAWYTGLGHENDVYSDPDFAQHLLGGILSAAGAAEADCSLTNGTDPEPPASDFDQVPLARTGQDLGEAMGLAVLPDGGVLTTARSGEVYYTAEAGDTRVAARLDVYFHNEEGAQGIALDPDFSENGWVYVYYSPRLDTPEGDAPASGTDEEFAEWEGHNQLSRFQFDAETGTLDLDSEQVILEVPTDRGLCCHAGGDIDFDSEGNLYLSVGDDTNPFESDGYSPIDDRPERNPAYDARRSSGNTNDLRGKLLRISVDDDGSYDIPDGNLFEPDTEGTRPEIYAMGLRNPFRFDIDTKTDTVWLGEYGPDANEASERGPRSMVSYHRIDEPGNYGWPFCVGDKTEEHTYAQYDFATGEVGEKYDCQGGATNDSRHNTGLDQVPPAEPGWLTYTAEEHPDLGSGSESPMGAVRYRYDPDSDVETRFPEEYDGQLFLAEFGREWIKNVTLDADDEIVSIEDFPWDGHQIIDHEFGPDGSLYVLDYGEFWFTGDPSTALYRIDHAPDNKRPVAELAAEPTAGHAPLDVEFSAEGSHDPEGTELSYAWDLTGDGETDATGETASHTYTEDGVYRAILRVTDADGLVGAAGVTIVVGNTPPEITFDAPAAGQFMDFGDTLDYAVTVTDEEDEEVNCGAVWMFFQLGHDNHAHGTNSTVGCEGSINTSLVQGHDTDDNIFGILVAQYTDSGAGDLPPVTTTESIVLQPKHRQAEYFTDSSGPGTVAASDAEGGQAVGSIDAGDWVSFDPMNFANTDTLSLRVAGLAGGTVEVRAGAPDGELVAGPIEIAAGDGEFVETDPVDITDPGGTHEVFFVFDGDGTELFLLDSLTVTGDGAGGGGSGGGGGGGDSDDEDDGDDGGGDD